MEIKWKQIYKHLVPFCIIFLDWHNSEIMKKLEGSNYKYMELSMMKNVCTAFTLIKGSSTQKNLI